MNVYVETNYVLELALLQKEHMSCQEILNLGERGKVNLIVPAFALTEPYQKLVRDDKRRKRLAKRVQGELAQMERSSSYQTQVPSVQPFINLLINSVSEEQRRLKQITDKLLRTAKVIPLDNEIISAASTHEIQQGFSPPDALVYASIVQHLTLTNNAPSCFVTTNSKDFSDPDIRDRLKNLNCKLIYKFEQALYYIRSQE